MMFKEHKLKTKIKGLFCYFFNFFLDESTKGSWCFNGAFLCQKLYIEEITLTWILFPILPFLLALHLSFSTFIKSRHIWLVTQLCITDLFTMVHILPADGIGLQVTIHNIKLAAGQQHIQYNGSSLSGRPKGLHHTASLRTVMDSESFWSEDTMLVRQY